jgi:hypothetical protein
MQQSEKKRGAGRRDRGLIIGANYADCFGRVDSIACGQVRILLEQAAAEIRRPGGGQRAGLHQGEGLLRRRDEVGHQRSVDAVSELVAGRGAHGGAGVRKGFKP